MLLFFEDPLEKSRRQDGERTEHREDVGRQLRTGEAEEGEDYAAPHEAKQRGSGQLPPHQASAEPAQHAGREEDERAPRENAAPDDGEEKP